MSKVRRSIFMMAGPILGPTNIPKPLPNHFTMLRRTLSLLVLLAPLMLLGVGLLGLYRFSGRRSRS